MEITFGKDTNVILEIAEKNTSVIVRETAGGVVVMIANSKENWLCKFLKRYWTAESRNVAKSKDNKKAAKYGILQQNAVRNTRGAN